MGKEQVCSVCGYRCGFKTQLANHMMQHNKPQFKCSYCGKMLMKKASLKAHENEHIGHKPFTCDSCGKSFTDRPALAQHKRLVHKIAGPKAKPMKRELARGIFEFKSE